MGDKNFNLTKELLHTLFEYKDGNLYWKIRKSNKTHVGDIVGTLNNNGYYVARIDGNGYGLHRIIFMWHYGYMPKMIDHIDGNKSNNKIENLRECTPKQNQQNKKIRIDNKSGVKGVYKVNNRWRAKCKVGDTDIHVGYFSTLNEAKKSY